MRARFAVAALTLIAAAFATSEMRAAEAKPLPFATDCGSASNWRSGGVNFYLVTGQSCTVAVAGGVYLDYQSGTGAATAGVVWEPSTVVIEGPSGYALIGAKDGCINSVPTERKLSRCNDAYAKAT